MGILIFKNGKVTTSKSSGGSYDGTKDMGDLNNWRLLSNDSNDILDSTYGLLVDRSATLYHTYGPARGAINKQTDYGIGPGLVFRSQPDWETLGWNKKKGRDWGKEFQKLIDSYYRRLGFYEKQAFLFRTALYGGDSFMFFLREKGLLTDLVETQNNQVNWEFNQDDYTLGIKHDEWLRRKGIIKTDGKEVSFQNSAGDQNVIQFYIKELARQLRGYPLAYAIINLARNDDTHTDAITHRAVMESIMMGTFESNGTDMVKQAQNLSNANRKKKGLAQKLFNRSDNALNMGAGSVMTVNSGEKLTFSDLKTPSNNFDAFKQVIRDYIGMATGTPPEVIASKYNTSFTAHKGALNDFVKSYMNKRVTFSRTVCDVVNNEILKDAITQGFIDAPGFLSGNWRIQQAYLRGTYLGPVPGHINPLVEVKADELAVKNEFKLRSDISSMTGAEFDNFSSEWEKEQREWANVPSNFADTVSAQEAINNDNGINDDQEDPDA